MKVDRSKSLDELDPPAWGEPNYDSHLVLEREPLLGRDGARLPGRYWAHELER